MRFKTFSLLGLIVFFLNLSICFAVTAIQTRCGRNLGAIIPDHHFLYEGILGTISSPDGRKLKVVARDDRGLFSSQGRNLQWDLPIKDGDYVQIYNSDHVFYEGFLNRAPEPSLNASRENVLLDFIPKEIDHAQWFTLVTSGQARIKLFSKVQRKKSRR